MDILLFAVMTASNILCVIIGAKIGQKVAKGEEVKLPTVNPMQAFKEHRERREAEKEQDKIETIMRNIEAYNGTSDGQKDLPR